MTNSTKWHSRIPVSINTAYGDPLLDIQIDDTCWKLDRLREQDAPIGFATKAAPSERALEKISEFAGLPNFVVRYSLTGLNEGDIDMPTRIKSLEALRKSIPNMAVLLRPVIPGRNDDIENISEIVSIAADTTQALVFGGVHDKVKRKVVNADLEAFVQELCARKGVKFFFKSACAAAALTGNPCHHHEVDETPVPDGILAKLGAELEQDVVVLEYATMGDLNFLRLALRKRVVTKHLISNYNLISFLGEECECTSSWFEWSKNLRECLACDYCIIHSIEYLKREKNIGMDPAVLDSAFVDQDSRISKFKDFRGGKFVLEGETPRIDYFSARTGRPCTT